uniref:type II secretion system F family protein n=1 Tax=Waltera intestinalis TaxID=2606635 RepID=UPI003FF0EB1C
MATYGYKAITKAGKEVKGSLEADNKDLAMAELRRQELTVIDLGEQSFLTKDIDIQIGGWPKARDLSVMCRQFVSMTKAGVSILESLKMLCEQTENKRLQDALKEVRISVEKGETLADSMAEHPKVFPAIMVNMVAAGEASGSLEIALERVATQLERSHKTQAMVKKAMIYPIAVCLVAVIVTIVMLVVVIPNYEDMFSQLGTELPWITMMYVNLSHVIINYWYIIIPIIIALIIAIRYFAKTNLGKHVFGKMALKLPLIGKLTTKSASSMMARTMSTLLGAGVPLIEAVDIVSGVMSNIYFKEAMQDAKEEITIGMPLSRPLQESGLFPPMVYQMIRIGEESGNTEEMLDKLADYYDEEVEMSVQSLMAAMEPLIIIVLAVVVGGLIAACMMPMMQMYTALDNL